MQPEFVLPRQLHNEAIQRMRSGDAAAAQQLLLAAVRGAGADLVDPRTLKALWQVARQRGDWTTAIAAGFRAAHRDPLDFRFVDSVVKTVHDCPHEVLAPAGAYPAMLMPPAPPSLSVVIVSQEDARYAGTSAEFDRQFAAWPHERIRVKGATSMYDGYARGFAQSHGDIVLFAHDDIRFAVPDFAARLADVMAVSDLAGVAGTTRLSGPALSWAGHPHMHGAVVHRPEGEAAYECALMSLHGRRIHGAEALDGVFIAARREWVGRIGFDTTRPFGFHFYDVDFSYRARAAGARITIACDLALIHHSRGAYDDRWVQAQALFRDKHPHLDGVPGSHQHYYTVALADEAAVARHYAKLLAAWNLELEQ